MVKEIKCYEDSSGKLHKTPLEAHRAELALWLASTGAINEASAETLAKRMAENTGELMAVLASITRATPTPEPALVAA